LFLRPRNPAEAPGGRGLGCACKICTSLVRARSICAHRQNSLFVPNSTIIARAAWAATFGGASGKSNGFQTFLFNVDMSLNYFKFTNLKITTVIQV